MASIARADWLSVGIVIAVTAVGVVLLPDLLPAVAIHFSASGTPDNYVPRLLTVVFVPFVMLATVAIVRGAARLDPPNDPRSMDVVVVGTTTLLGAIHLVVLGWNLGYRVPMTLVSVGAVAWMTVIAGYVVLNQYFGSAPVTAYTSSMMASRSSRQPSKAAGDPGYDP